MIKLIGLNKVYGKGSDAVHALRDVSLHVPQGKIFGVIGASGAGKSTLIRCVNLLERPTEGQVIVDGQDLVALSERDLTQARRQIGMIFQHFNLLASRTVSANIAFPLELAGWSKDKIQSRVSELLALVGLEARAHAYPSELSGGQKQRRHRPCPGTGSQGPAVRRGHLGPRPADHPLDPDPAQGDQRQAGAHHPAHHPRNGRGEGDLRRSGHHQRRPSHRAGEVAWFFSNAKTQLARDFIHSTIHLEVPRSIRIG
jgi:D-methionine transport system ATP-binding protein